MNTLLTPCPLCKRWDALGKPWPISGSWAQTCFGLNRPEHLGRRHHFNPETGDPLVVVNGVHARILSMLAEGNACDMRGFPGPFLRDHCGIARVSAGVIDAATASLSPQLGMWARHQERQGKVIAVLPVSRGINVVGAQLRAFIPGAES